MGSWLLAFVTHLQQWSLYSDNLINGLHSALSEAGIISLILSPNSQIILFVCVLYCDKHYHCVCNMTCKIVYRWVFLYIFNILLIHTYDYIYISEFSIKVYIQQQEIKTEQNLRRFYLLIITEASESGGGGLAPPTSLQS